MDKRSQFLLAVFESGNIRKAQLETGISRTTAYKYLNDAQFQTELQKLRTQVLHEATLHMQKSVGRAIDVLNEIIDSPETKPAVKVSAIHELLLSTRAFTEQTETKQLLMQLLERMNDYEREYTKSIEEY